MPETPQWPTEECRSCHKPVIWCVTDLRKSMPVDGQPSADGTMALSWDIPGQTRVRATVVKPDHLRFGRKDLHKSHFATCPDAGKWRRPRPRRRAA